MIDLAPFLGLGLMLVRPGTLMLAAPTFGGTYAPAQVKVALTVLLAVSLMPLVNVPVVSSTVGLTAVVAREMAIGLALALAIRALVAAAEFGGHLAGFQMGLSYSALVDPASGVRNELLAVLYANIATFVFLMTNAHHAFLQALSRSYQSLPIGGGQIGDSLPSAVTALLVLVFSLGLRLAAPLVVVLIITELGLALVARSAPALNLMAVGAPFRLIVGLILLGFVAPAAVGVFSSAPAGVLQLGVRIAEAFR